MRTLRSLLEAYQRSTGSAWNLIEQDYALSLILYGIANVDELKKHLIFKGGTCLRKYYFGDYRFSQDADFSVQGTHPTNNELYLLLNKACTLASNYLLQKNVNSQIECVRYTEKKPHPTEQEAFMIAIQYPWHREPLTRVMVEVTSAERVVLRPIEKPIIHTYEPNFTANLLVYPLEEVVAEKVRALIQFHIKLHERGWGRSRARDYYDLWRILQSYKNSINLSVVHDVVKRKCQNKKINFEGYHQIFSEVLMNDLESAWDRWVRPLVPENLPQIKSVVEDLKKHLSTAEYITEDLIERVWEKTPLHTSDSTLKMDHTGNFMRRHSYGSDQPERWRIEKIDPDGAFNIKNLRAVCGKIS